MLSKLIYQWYILFVRGGQEEKIIAKVKEELKRNKELEKYVHDLKIAQGKEKKKIVRSYIFCSCSLTPELVDFLYNIEGVIGFLNYKRGEKNKLPDFYPEKVIENFFTQIEKKQESLATTSNDEVNVGDNVIITEGIFANREGKIVYLDDKKEKAKIDIDFMGQTTTIDISTKNCRKALS